MPQTKANDIGAGLRKNLIWISASTVLSVHGPTIFKLINVGKICAPPKFDCLCFGLGNLLTSATGLQRNCKAGEYS
jgi:hypothetical protein